MRSFGARANGPAMRAKILVSKLCRDARLRFLPIIRCTLRREACRRRMGLLWAGHSLLTRIRLTGG